MPSADDLEDDYVSDTELVSSEAEDSGKGDYDEFQGLRTDPLGISQLADISRKRKRRAKEKEKKAKKRKLLVAQSIEEPVSVAGRPPAEIQAYMSAQQAIAFPKLSSLELDEIKIPENWLADTTSFTGPRTLDHIGDFIEEILPELMTRLGQKPRDNGSPTLIFIAAAALRVADVTRMLKQYRGKKGGDIAKLFAKHFKLQEHIVYLRRTKVGAAIGTPGRLGQLLAKGALGLTALTHVIIDLTYRDAKKRSMFDIPETRDELFRVLSDESMRAAFHSGKPKLVFF